MIGRIFLLVVLCGVGFVAYRVVGLVWPGERAEPAVVRSEPAVVEPVSDVADYDKAEVPAVDDHDKDDELVVLAWSREWILVEQWGVVHFGEEMPCGGVLQRIKGRALSVWRDGREVVVFAANHARLLAERTASQMADAVNDAKSVAAAVQPNPLPSLGGLFGPSDGSDK